ncbi:hypothetical protein I551_5197 [Mycobacterium ulcerans str. Harvey]|uniref:Uncharacterized protein n=1 Tax=Mycobacterium ulcerans str. Harvey TaxID=1299332 RepID=A0ABN0QUI9_MYCUL|nr:hypothetical protein I551_5197 [Mycobacterium ulcerans str. Harvey]
MVLHLAHRINEPAVVRSALVGWLRRIEAAARVLRLFAGHPTTVLPAASQMGDTAAETG